MASIHTWESFGLRRKQRRHIIAVYPDGTRFEIRKTRYGWQYHPRGSIAFPLECAKAEARDEGATINVETY